MKVSFRKIILAVASTTVLAFMSGCGGPIPIMSDVKESQGYTDAQTMLIVATERNRYREVYTDQIWQVPVDDEGNVFQAYLLGEVQNFLKEMKTTNLLAEEREISLTSQEKEEIQKLADQFYESMTEADLAYTGASKEDVCTMYAEYHLANKLVDELTKDVNLEISDSEAKVIAVQEIVLSDRETAEAVQGQAAGEHADFENIAKSMSENKTVETPVGRGERPKAYEEVVFALEAGQVSPVIPVDGQYYIVKCINDYDEEATLERKKKLSLQRKQQAFRGIYESFAAEHPVEIGGGLWDKISFADGADSTTTEFFELYQECMGKDWK